VDAWIGIDSAVDFIKANPTMNRFLILDGYWLPNYKGYAVILYNLFTNQLFQWHDRTIVEHFLIKGEVSSSLSDYPILIHTMKNLLSGNEEIISEVVSDKLKFDKQLRKNYAFVNTSASKELRYFQRKQLIPGSIISLQPTNTSHPLTYDLLKDEMLEKSLKSKFLGEHQDVVNLAMLYTPVLNQKIPNLRRIAFDIEVISAREKFPLPEKAEYPISVIATFDSEYQSVLFMFGLEPTKSQKEQIKMTLGYSPSIYAYPSERQMIIHAMKYLETYPMILSFNGDNFDLKYILTRCEKLNITCNIVEGHYQSNKPSYHFKNSIHLDLYRFFSNNAIRIYAFNGKYADSSLDTISEALLGYKKIAKTKWFDEMTREEIVTYSSRDVELTFLLTSFSNNLTLNLMIILMRVAKLSITFVNRSPISKYVLNLFAYEHARMNAILPSKKEIMRASGSFKSDATITGKQFKGAIVLNPMPGTYFGVDVADFASLYPSVIKLKNLSYETMNCSHDICKNNKIPEVGHHVCRIKRGITAIFLGFIRELRVKFYKPLIKEVNDKDQKILYDTIQSSLKVLINASYGVFGAETFHLFCPPVAESTTAYSRYLLGQSKEMASSSGIKVIYGDTDSIFLLRPKDKNHSYFTKLELWSIINVGIPLTIDYQFNFLCLSNRKKNYFGVTEDRKIVVKGLQIKKSTTPLFFKNLFRKVSDLFLDVHDQESFHIAKQSMISLIRNALNQLKHGKVELTELSYLVSLNKPFSEYTAKSLAIQIAFQEINDDFGSDITQGSQFNIINVKSFDVTVKTSLFRYFPKGNIIKARVTRIENLSNYNRIDFDHYYKMFQKIFGQLFETMGLNFIQEMNSHTELTHFF